VKHFRKDIIKVQVVGSLYKHRLLHGKMKIIKNIFIYLFIYLLTGDLGGTVVKVLCYKSEGRWFDPVWCHWYFLLA